MEAADDPDSDGMDDTPATPPPNVSEDGSGSEMATDEEQDILAYTGLGRDEDSSSDGFERI